jgi:hypothetical protein
MRCVGVYRKSWLNKPILKCTPADSPSTNVEDVWQMGRSSEIQGFRKDVGVNVHPWPST